MARNHSSELRPTLLPLLVAIASPAQCRMYNMQHQGWPRVEPPR